MPVLIAWIALALLAPAQRLAPYAATPHDVVDRMLALAGVTATDVVVDLGCGDGRIPVRAAQKFGARGRGVDLDPRRIDEAQANARAAGVEHLTEFVVGDALKADVSEATVVTLFLGSEGNAQLRLEDRARGSCRTPSAWGPSGRPTGSSASPAPTATRSRSICGSFTQRADNC